MSDGSAHLVIGVRISKEDFFSTVGSKSACYRGHPSAWANSDYCSKCGSKVTVMDIKEPNDALKLLASRVNLASVNQGDPLGPRAAWDHLLEEGEILRDLTVPRLGIHGVGAIESNQDDAKQLAIGFRVSQHSNGSGSQPNATPLTRVGHCQDILDALLTDCFPRRPVELFLTFYWSV